MEYIIAIVIFIFLAILFMTATTMLYHLLSAIVPVIFAIMLIVGMVVGLWNAIKNTVIVSKEVFRKR